MYPVIDSKGTCNLNVIYYDVSWKFNVLTMYSIATSCVYFVNAEKCSRSYIKVLFVDFLGRKFGILKHHLLFSLFTILISSLSFTLPPSSLSVSNLWCSNIFFKLYKLIFEWLAKITSKNKFLITTGIRINAYRNSTK